MDFSSGVYYIIWIYYNMYFIKLSGSITLSEVYYIIC